MYERGEHIIIGGVSAAGKTTQAELLALTISSNNIDILDKTEATKSQKIAEEIGTRLVKHGTTIISEGGWLHNFAYSNIGNDHRPGVLIQHTQNILGSHLLPDKWAIIDIPAEVAVERIQSGYDDFDVSLLDFDLLTSVIKNYRYIAKKFRIPLIDGKQDPEIVQKELNSIFEL